MKGVFRLLFKGVSVVSVHGTQQFESLACVKGLSLLLQVAGTIRRIWKCFLCTVPFIFYFPP